jgi:hypothetical protein
MRLGRVRVAFAVTTALEKAWPRSINSAGSAAGHGMMRKSTRSYFAEVQDAL